MVTVNYNMTSSHWKYYSNIIWGEVGEKTEEEVEIFTDIQTLFVSVHLKIANLFEISDDNILYVSISDWLPSPLATVTHSLVKPVESLW